MALRIDDYFDEDDRPDDDELTPDDEFTAGFKEDKDKDDDEEVTVEEEEETEEDKYREDFIVTNSQRRRKRLRRILICAAAVIVVAVLVNVLFISKKVEKGCLRGYLVKIELCDGILFDSYECTMVADYPDRVTNPDELITHFSIRDKKLGEHIYNAMKGDSMLLIDYVRYATHMPWRGNSDVVVDSAIVVKASPVVRSPQQVALDKETANSRKN